MDLNTITRFRRPRSRSELVLAPGEVLLAGGTWLFSEPQPQASGLVDLTALEWPALEVTDRGLRVAATCTIAELVGLPPQPGWTAQPFFRACADALLMSFKIWGLATVGGNICRSFAAGAMVTLAATLDAEAEIWRPDGTDRRAPVAGLITGNGTNSLAPGEVLRAIEIPHRALSGTTALRKIALARLGRSGAVLTGRLDADGSALFVITAATLRPVLLRYPELPDADTLRAGVAAASGYYTDPLGAADWRRQVSQVLMEEVRAELGQAGSVPAASGPVGR
ncbi:MAG: FAD binding domain-containing protein [Micropruina sp.]|uniref:FAD binding domain-containing protein n=1 Tax=Micropruina sp. TaxID=2737536 RepID=UPI0039E432A8